MGKDPELLQKSQCPDLSGEMGFYTWNLSSDRCFGDDVFTRLFSLDLRDVKEGVPIEQILARVWDQDRPRLARAIHQAITSGSFYTETYHVLQRSGGYREITAFGRCLRFSDGTPSHYTGFVVDASTSPVVTGETPIEVHSRAALRLAEDQGLSLAARYLRSVLGVLDGDARSGS
ncbi:PAS domain-containing protein [Rhizobium wenxiniae]|uniref:PAS domain-containing protein n=1 Tax=Rhizobium wenxiniae TaxID=1737357 RepID=UPI001C6E1BEF|nr:PAS domain-containing protein [Rhizobium wenxiniae]